MEIKLVKIRDKQHILCVIGFPLGNLWVPQSGRIKEMGRIDCKYKQ